MTDLHPKLLQDSGQSGAEPLGVEKEGQSDHLRFGPLPLDDPLEPQPPPPEDSCGSSPPSPVYQVNSALDGIQFGYIRFPDDGEIGRQYPERYAAVNAFLRRAREELFMPISIELFGQMLWPWNKKRDPIGQCLEEIAPYVDVSSPMLYPSHYVEPELKTDPYRTVKLPLTYGMARVKVPFRPYPQAFEINIPPGITLPEHILAQVRATEEMGADGTSSGTPALTTLVCGKLIN